MTPAPRPVHQTRWFALARALHDALPAGLQVLMAPVDVRIDDAVVLQPDLLVVARSEVGERFVRNPVLVVEVLSPSTRDIDLTLKKARYERAGCAHYWVVDPDGPALTAWDLRDGHYATGVAGPRRRTGVAGLAGARAPARADGSSRRGATPGAP
jgi:Uma2 family endonuclease